MSALGQKQTFAVQSPCPLYPLAVIRRHDFTVAGLRRRPPPPIWDHHRHTNLVRLASLLRADMIFGKDNGLSIGKKRAVSIARLLQGGFIAGRGR
jgi:hypothetical protein